jgi:hypothetical protein
VTRDFARRIILDYVFYGVIVSPSMKHRLEEAAEPDEDFPAQVARAHRAGVRYREDAYLRDQPLRDFANRLGELLRGEGSAAA